MEGLVAFSHTSNTCLPCLCDCSSQPLLTIPEAHKYGQAIDLYTQAIELNSQNVVYWANRSLAHTKLEEYGSGIQDATKYFQQLRTMVLSSYFEWQTDVPMNERKIVEAESETQLAAADGLECYWNAFELPYTFPASYLDPQNYTSLLPLYSIPPEVIPYETFTIHW
ncbi:hypothetical protein ES288_A02G165200v1 [Gossypium darwinii]|uniref:Uncharacterized protein n=1 Tax=Gossypium darwinii TaxID=34276 RepID=A0A5D2HGR1_GOSDA|nr:hypothetical protein ES288_A02G165200v1 [Gossypium darwinii]